MSVNPSLERYGSPATFPSTTSHLSLQISLARSRIASIWSGSVAETLWVVVNLHDRVDLRRCEEEPPKGLGARRRALRRQQGRLGVAVVEGEEDRDGIGQRRSVLDNKAGNLAVGIDCGVFLAPLLIVTEGKLSKLVVGPDFGEHALHRA